MDLGFEVELLVWEGRSVGGDEALAVGDGG